MIRLSKKMINLNKNYYKWKLFLKIKKSNLKLIYNIQCNKNVKALIQELFKINQNKNKKLYKNKKK